MKLNFLGISGSLRRQSCNSGLLRMARTLVPEGVTFDIADLSEVPFYNADIQVKPATVQRVLDQMVAADAFVFACPEYNYSMAPALKNILDWASREKDNSLLSDKAVAIMGAGGGMGTSRAQYHLRQICVFLNLHPLNKPEMFANAFTGGFDAEGNPADPAVVKMIADQMHALLTWVQRIKN